MNENDFLINVKEFLNLNLSEKQLQMFKKYFNILIIENKKYNLTTIVEEKDVYLKHFFDSLIPIKDFEFNNKKIADIGSGAGFPGIPLAIVFENSEFYLIESNSKKCLFLEMVIKQLELKNVKVINSRVEELNHKEFFDVVTSRAVSKINILIEISSQLITIGGNLVCLKSKSYLQEIGELNNKENEVGFVLENSHKYEIDNLGTRVTVIYKKNSKTPKIYPRKYGHIKNKPLGS
ncbi:16S rRNA (guanine(527)-N(7))-methyltransferase RsmG [Spiroplasma endosymbiont of Crioceris asparagi]|uniref:16S rRNA (guanine(527)-N(7))-methyltransferase RsmG n=1 Tax=Spiroplasma endosymbiont of Crioceris asparagi TaxID=3066286 RepID=UPI0030D2ED15